MSGSPFFIPGLQSPQTAPLARYLPPLEHGQVSKWLQERFPTGTWVLDPFGSAPSLVVEAARAGYKVLVAVNNPILRLLLELEAAAPSAAEMRASLAELASSYKGDQRLEPHIRSLYESHCTHCQGVLEVECFLWEKGADHPYARIYTCPHCGDSGEHPTLSEDREKALQFAASGLHRARALERVAPLGDPDRDHAVEALSVYLPRAVYALFTLINKLNALSLPSEKRSRLEGLVTYACDRANTLWPHPTQRERPRQLTVPPKFRENNLWMALEQAVNLYGNGHAGSVVLRGWPEPLPEEGGILLYQGRLKELEGKKLDFQCEAAFTAIPRPNQAFWTLSALWSGWLWGRESAGSLRTVLRRRRYDWGWHSGALSAVFARLKPFLAAKAPFFSLIGEAEPGLISAALAAGSWNGFDMEGAALRAESAICQVHFRMTGGNGEPELPEDIEQWTKTANAAAKGYLRERGQPSPYLPLHTSALSSIINEMDLEPKGGDKPTHNESFRVIDYFNLIQSAIKEALTFRGGFLRFEGSSQNLEVGQWWLKDNKQDPEGIHSPPPLADRVEKALVQNLVKNRTVSQKHLELEMCKAFPGIMTPDLSLLAACLESYAHQEAPESGDWHLNAEDNPRTRRQDLITARQAVMKLGNKLGFIAEEILVVPNPRRPSETRAAPVAWLETKDQIPYLFYFIASAIISSIGEDIQPPARSKVLVFPIPRSQLISYKLNRDPRLLEAVKAGWKFMNFRQLGQFLENPLTTRKTFEDSLMDLPVTESEAQLRLL